MTYKMIVLDLDDTLLRDDHTISPRTKEALMTAQEQGDGRVTVGRDQELEPLDDSQVVEPL